MYIWWKDLLVKLTLLYALFKIGGFLYSMYQAYYSLDNPLIPEYLSSFMAFPVYFLIPIWMGIAFICYRLIKRERLMKKWFPYLMIGVLVYQLVIEAYLYHALLIINSYS